MPSLPVLVVDDGSQDATANVALAAGAGFFDRTMGAMPLLLWQGIGFLLSAGWIRSFRWTQTDSTPQQRAPSMFGSLERANWVVGSREGSHSPGTWSRKIGNAALSRVVNQLVDLQLRDVTSGFWALDRKALEVFLLDFLRTLPMRTSAFWVLVPD